MTTSEKRIYHMATVAQVRDIANAHKDACSYLFLLNFDNATTLTTPYTKGFRCMTKNLLLETLGEFTTAEYRLSKKGYILDANKVNEISKSYMKFFGLI